MSDVPHAGGPLFIAYNLWQEYQNRRKDLILSPLTMICAELLEFTVHLLSYYRIASFLVYAASQERLLCEFLASLPEDTRKKVTGVAGI